MSDDNTSDDVLVIEEDERRQNAFKIDIRYPPSVWKEALQRHSTFQTLSIIQPFEAVLPPVPVDAKVVMTQLAVALRSRPHGFRRISRIQFWGSRVVELGMLCRAVLESSPYSTPLPSSSSSSSSPLLLALEFHYTSIDRRSLKTICCLLKDNLLDDLRLNLCNMDGRSHRMLQASLSINTSLRHFHSTSPLASNKVVSQPISICDLLRTSQNRLVRLHVSVPDNNKAMWSLCHAATKGHPTSVLQSLQIIYSRIHRPAMAAVMMMCLTMKSSQDLHFQACKLSRSALEYLDQIVSNRNILEKLAIERSKMQDSDNQNSYSLDVNLGNVQVQKLSFQGTKFERNAFAQMIEDIGNNPFINSLNVSHNVVADGGHVKLNEAILQQNRGPSELVIDGVENDEYTIIAALQHNTSLKTLTIYDSDASKLLPFADSVANMSNLCKLTFCFEGSRNLPEEFFRALELGMEQNTSLQSLTIRGVGVEDEVAKRCMARIRYYLAINRIKRNSLMTEPDVPTGLWAHVLSKTSTERDGIYYVLTAQPDIVTVAATQ